MHLGIRQRLPGKILTVAATIVPDTIPYWGTAHTNLDRVNVMTYDMGSVLVADHNFGLAWVNAALSAKPLPLFYIIGLLPAMLHTRWIWPGSVLLELAYNVLLQVEE